MIKVSDFNSAVQYINFAKNLTTFSANENTRQKFLGNNLQDLKSVISRIDKGTEQKIKPDAGQLKDMREALQKAEAEFARLNTKLGVLPANRFAAHNAKTQSSAPLSSAKVSVFQSNAPSAPVPAAVSRVLPAPSPSSATSAKPAAKMDTFSESKQVFTAPPPSLSYPTIGQGEIHPQYAVTEAVSKPKTLDVKPALAAPPVQQASLMKESVPARQSTATRLKNGSGQLLKGIGSLFQIANQNTVRPLREFLNGPVDSLIEPWKGSLPFNSVPPVQVQNGLVELDRKKMFSKAFFATIPFLSCVSLLTQATTAMSSFKSAHPYVYYAAAIGIAASLGMKDVSKWFGNYDAQREKSSVDLFLTAENPSPALISQIMGSEEAVKDLVSKADNEFLRKNMYAVLPHIHDADIFDLYFDKVDLTQVVTNELFTAMHQLNPALEKSIDEKESLLKQAKEKLRSLRSNMDTVLSQIQDVDAFVSYFGKCFLTREEKFDLYIKCASVNPKLLKEMVEDGIKPEDHAEILERAGAARAKLIACGFKDKEA